MAKQIKASVKYGVLEDMIKAMSSEYSVRVGLLGTVGGDSNVIDADGKVAKDIDVAGLGAVHEFGTDKIPARSFLEMPLVQHSKGFKEKFFEPFKNYGDREYALKHIQENKDLASVAIILGGAAVKHIKEAFKTKGFGEWEELKPSTIRQKKQNPDKILIETGKNLHDHIAADYGKDGGERRVIKVREGNH